MKILVTGATGFVGRAVCRTLLGAGHTVAAAVREPGLVPPEVCGHFISHIGPDTEWGGALDAADAVVHLAARAHVMRDHSADPLAAFRQINRDGALRLAEQAAGAGIRHFVFISSIKVNGEATDADRPFKSGDAPNPQDPYAHSKAEAEAGLRLIAARTGLGLTILRPPLVHGPGAKGNLATLMSVLRRRWPLPLGAIDNRRSLVGLENLADAIRFCLATPATRGETLLVSDGEAIATPELLRRLGRFLGYPAVLLPVPPAILRFGGRLIGRGAMIERLTGSLVVDDSPLRAMGWEPPVTLDQGLAAMAGGCSRS